MDEHSQNAFWCPETDSHLLDAEVRWQSAIGLEGHLEFVEVLAGNEGRVQLDWQHAEVPLERVL